VVAWNLHVAATEAERTKTGEVVFHLPNQAGRLIVSLPTEPRSIHLTPGECTTQLSLVYPEVPLHHVLRIDR
jgi:hypothetical protein